MSVKLGTLLVLLLVLAQVSTARASGFIADLSHHLIAITTAFTGSNVLLFGALDEAGGDVVVVVRGPETTATVRRKRRVGPVWLNTDEVIFTDVPAFYAVAASGLLPSIMAEDERARFGIGTEKLALQPLNGVDRTPIELASFREALVRNKARDDLYAIEVAPVRFLGDYPRLVARLRGGGLVVSSGNLVSRRSELLARFAELGLEPAGEKVDGEWVAFLLRKVGR